MLESNRTACEFCGVPFQIGRIRTAHEPEIAAWTRDGNGYVDGFETCRRDIHGCTASAGLERDNSPRDVDTTIDKDWATNFLADTLLDYAVSSEGGRPAGGNIASVSWQSEAISYLKEIAADVSQRYAPEDGVIQAEMDNFSDSSSESWSRNDRQDEHLAGPDCQDRDGYNGNKISAEEMKYCNTLQCLIDKRTVHGFGSPWFNGTTPDEEEPLERESMHFFSGLVDNPGVLLNFQAVPNRWGTDDSFVANVDVKSDLSRCMPFHPHCFDIFRRVSMSRVSRSSGHEFDIDTLMEWWRAALPRGPFGRFFYGSAGHDLSLCQSPEDGWQHTSGKEYLAADPLFPKGLQPLFEQVIQSKIVNGVFDVKDVKISDKRDILSKLPSELGSIVLDHLDVKDVASLRLASRSFQQLPNSYFRDLLRKEQPWLWEAWPRGEQTPHFKWATTTATELRAWNHFSEYMALNIASKVVNQTSPVPGLIDAIQDSAKDERELVTRLKGALKGGGLTATALARRHPFTLPHDRTNWYQLYMLSKKRSLDILGLRNRKRIWKHCEDILTQIDGSKRGDAVAAWTSSS